MVHSAVVGSTQQSWQAGVADERGAPRAVRHAAQRWPDGLQINTVVISTARTKRHNLGGGAKLDPMNHRLVSRIPLTNLLKCIPKILRDFTADECKYIA